METLESYRDWMERWNFSEENIRDLCITRILGDTFWPKDEGGNSLPDCEVSEAEYQVWCRKMEAERLRIGALKKSARSEWEKEADALFISYAERLKEREAD